MKQSHKENQIKWTKLRKLKTDFPIEIPNLLKRYINVSQLRQSQRKKFKEMRNFFVKSLM